ncbi:MAG TPA: hypothetical protein VGK00_02040 [Anaerolineales bacterium]|jgi:hypothetical protein
MDNPTYYEIRVHGQLTDQWSDWFDELVIRNEAEGESTITGPFSDQAALMGLLNRLAALNIKLISVRVVEQINSDN